MTNEQLSILLDQLHTEFSAALDSARASIAAMRPKVRERRHVVSFPECLGIACQNPDHFEEINALDPVAELAPVEAAIDRLSDHIVLLARHVS